MKKITIEQIKTALRNANAEEQKSVDLCSDIRAALVPFEGRQITKRLATAVEKALPGAVVFYEPDTFYARISVWGGTTGRTINNRFTVYFGGYQQATFSLATFDDKNASCGSAAVKRIEARNRLLNSYGTLFDVVLAANAQYVAQQATKDALAMLNEVAGCTFGASDAEKVVEDFLK